MKLTKYLNDNGLKPKEFAEKIGVTDEAIRRYCKGSRRPSTEVMRAIIKETGGIVTANDFYDGQDEPADSG